MAQELVKELVENTLIMLSKLESGYSAKERRYPANVANAIFNILRLYTERIEPLDYIYLTRKFTEIYERLIDTTYSHFFGNLYQSLLSYQYHNFSRLEFQTNWAIYDMEIMHVKILHAILNNSYGSLGDSLSNCFFDRIKSMIECDRLVLENQDLRRMWALTLYNSCTANRVLNLYLQTGDEAYRENVIRLVQKISSFLSEFLSKHDLEDIHKGISLHSNILYNLEINKRFVPQNDLIRLVSEKLKAYLSENYVEASIKDLCWICVNFYMINEPLFTECSTLLFDRLRKDDRIDKQDRPQLVLALAYFLSNKDIGELTFGFPADFNKVDFDVIFKTIFPKFLETEDMLITNSDIEKLHVKDDAEIRRALVEILKTSETIPGHIKERLDPETPHTGAEISDLEFPIEIGRDTVYVCFPIKSGREIPNTVPEKIIYQILRPFVHYRNCAVIFITAKKCSVNLKNMVEKYKNRFSVAIEILEDSHLAKLFKIYGLI